MIDKINSFSYNCDLIIYLVVGVYKYNRATLAEAELSCEEIFYQMRSIA